MQKCDTVWTAFPDTGNIQILIYVVAQSVDYYKQGVLQVEEIILKDAEIDAVIIFLRGLVDQFTSVQISRQESRSIQEFAEGIESSVTHTIDIDQIKQTPSKTEIADKILSRFGEWLAESPAWIFLPLSDLMILDNDPAIKDKATIVHQSSPWNNRADGTAIIRTSKGDVSVFREQGYTKVSWIS